MAKKDSPKKEKTKTTNQGGDIHVGGSVAGNNNVIGNNNIVHNYITIVEKNTKPNDPDYWNLKHPYPMPPNFTGRIAERAMLTHWLDGDSENRLFILRALGGFGKSALAWQWLTHDVNPDRWKKVVFWSFYEGDASFENFTKETLEYLGIEVPQGGRPQVDELLKAMQRDKILLIMDGFERVLRLYASMNAAYQGDEEEKVEENQLDCKDINAEWFLKGICQNPKIKIKVLMTTRLTPRAIKPHGEFMLGCRETELTAMQKVDAVEFFHKQGIKGNRAEIEFACEPYGYHPLSLRLLAGRILKDFQNPGDISVTQKLIIDGDIIQQKHHVLDASYNSLPEQEQKLLSTIACFRSPVEMKTLESIRVGASHDSPLQNQLHDLVDRGLLHFDSRTKKFDLHPIVRRYAYDRLTATDRTNAHERLVNYFEAIPKPEKVEKLEDLAPVIELYHHMVRAGNLDEACDLYHGRFTKTIFFQFGAYQLCVELLRALFPDGEDKPPRLKKESDQAWTLNELANSYALSGQPRRAVPIYEIVTDLEEKVGDKQNLAIGLGAMADVALMPIGALSIAKRNLCRRIDLCREIADEYNEAIGHSNLGRILSFHGAWQAAEQELDLGLKVFKKHREVQGQSIVWSYHALRFMFLGRQTVDDRQSLILTLNLAIECARRALELAEGGDPNIGGAVVPRDLVRSRWLLGSAHRAVSTAKRSTTDELTLAEENLSKALDLCRQINLVETEADILLDVARLRYAQGDFKDAQEKASEALGITERSGYVLQGADVNLFLAQYALEQEKDKVKAKVYAEKAKQLATGWEEIDGNVIYDTTGKYVYKVAYEEAEAMLEKLK